MKLHFQIFDNWLCNFCIISIKFNNTLSSNWHKSCIRFHNSSAYLITLLVLIRSGHCLISKLNSISRRCPISRYLWTRLVLVVAREAMKTLKNRLAWRRLRQHAEVGSQMRQTTCRQKWWMMYLLETRLKNYSATWFWLNST